MEVIIHDRIPYHITIKHEKISLRINTASKGELVISSEDCQNPMSIDVLKSTGRQQSLESSHIFIKQPSLTEVAEQ